MRLYFGEMTVEQRTTLVDGLVNEGLFRRVGDGYKYIGPVDLQKLAQLEADYAEGFNIRYEERRRKELEAWKKLQREGPWYF